MKKQTHSQLPPEHSPACWSASPDLCLWSVGLLLASGVAEWAGLVQSTLPDSEPDLTNRKVKRSAFRDHTHKHFAHDPTKKSLSHQCVHFLHFSICMYAFWLVKYDWTRIHYVARRTGDSDRWRWHQYRGSAAARLTPCWSLLGGRWWQGRGCPSLAGTLTLSWHIEEAWHTHTNTPLSIFDSWSNKTEIFRKVF